MSAPQHLALVLAGGRVVATPALRTAAARADLVIAADGGLRHARTLAVTPDLLVGDLDSVGSEVLARWPDLPRDTHPRDKAALDLELALGAALERGATHLLIVGALGDRLDQSLAAVAIAEHVHRSGVDVSVDSGDACVLPLRPNQRQHVPLPSGTVFSLLATRSDTRVSVAGARWPLHEQGLAVGSGHGVSNEAAEEGPLVTLHSGGCIVVVPSRRVPAAATIWGPSTERIRAGLTARHADLATLIERVAYDEVFERPGLDLRTRELLALAHLIALGQVDQLRTHLHGALRAGATPDELRELVVHAAMFVGFPRALAAADAVRDVLGEPAVP